MIRSPAEGRGFVWYLLEELELLRLLLVGLLFVAEVLLGVALLVLEPLHLVPELQGLPLQLLVLLHALVQLIAQIFGFLFQLTLDGHFLLSLMLDPAYLEIWNKWFVCF